MTGRPLKYPLKDLELYGERDVLLHSDRTIRVSQIKSLRVAAVRYGRRHDKTFSVNVKKGVATIRRTA